MKKQLLLLSMMVLAILNVKATDLLVEEFGISPVYNNISAAVAAAADGDRIVIRNRAGNIPWVEDININKSLTFLPFDNDTFFVVQGNYTITPGSNREISVIGMKNTNGNILGLTGASVTARTVVNILGSYLVNGSISLNNAGYDVSVAHTLLDDGSISFQYGSVIGCDVTDNSSSGLINVSSETTSAANTIKIYGNKIYNTSSSSSAHGISWNSTAHFLDIRNNFIQTRNIGINIGSSRNAASEINKVYNNTIAFVSTLATNTYGIYCNSASSGTVIEIMNNLVDINTNSSSNFYGIYNTYSAPQVNLYFNAVDGSIISSRQYSGAYTVNSNNIAGVVTTSASGNNSGSSIGFDAGNPSNVFFDLDLTQNDCGAYGGSYSLANFFPIHAGAARVYLVNYPFNVRQGSTLSIDGKTYDR